VRIKLSVHEFSHYLSSVLLVVLTKLKFLKPITTHPPFSDDNDLTSSEGSFLASIQALHSTRHLTRRNKLMFSFYNTDEAKQSNAEILQKHNFDISMAIQAQSGSIAYFGSEFRSPSELEGLLSQHPNWSHLKEILTNGATFPLRPISEETRKIDLEFHLNRGKCSSIQNHRKRYHKRLCASTSTSKRNSI